MEAVAVTIAWVVGARRTVDATAVGTPRAGRAVNRHKALDNTCLIRGLRAHLHRGSRADRKPAAEGAREAGGAVAVVPQRLQLACEETEPHSGGIGSHVGAVDSRRIVGRRGGLCKVGRINLNDVGQRRGEASSLRAQLGSVEALVWSTHAGGAAIAQQAQQSASARASIEAQHDRLSGYTIQRRELVLERRLVDCGRVARLNLKELLKDRPLRRHLLNARRRRYLLSARHDRRDAAWRVHGLRIVRTAWAKSPAGTRNRQNAPQRRVKAWLHILALRLGSEASAVAKGACVPRVGESVSARGFYFLSQRMPIRERLSARWDQK